MSDSRQIKKHIQFLLIKIRTYMDKIDPNFH